MLASGLTFVGMTGIVRHLGTDLPAPQTAFLRFAFGLLFLLPAVIATLRAGFTPGALALFGWRGLAHSVAVILWFYAMARLPVAEVTAIGYLNPIGVTIGAALFLGERLALRRILAIAVAFIGALVILRPGLREVTLAHLAQVGAALMFAVSYLFAKRLTEIAGAGAVVAMMSLTVAVLLLPLALWVWVPPTLVQLFQLAGVAILATLGHYFMTRAFAIAPMTVTQPVTFLQLLWATLLGHFAFGDGIDPYVILGGLIIIAAISYITWREARLNRAPVTPPSGAGKF